MKRAIVRFAFPAILSFCGVARLQAQDRQGNEVPPPTAETSGNSEGENKKEASSSATTIPASFAGWSEISAYWQAMNDYRKENKGHLQVHHVNEDVVHLFALLDAALEAGKMKGTAEELSPERTALKNTLLQRTTQITGGGSGSMILKDGSIIIQQLGRIKKMTDLEKVYKRISNAPSEDDDEKPIRKQLKKGLTEKEILPEDLSDLQFETVLDWIEALARSDDTPPTVKVAGDDLDKIASLVNLLGDDSAEVRQSATEDLRKFGSRALPPLKKALETAEDPEVQLLLQELIAEFE